MADEIPSSSSCPLSVFSTFVRVEGEVVVLTP